MIRVEWYEDVCPSIFEKETDEPFPPIKRTGRIINCSYSILEGIQTFIITDNGKIHKILKDRFKIIGDDDDN
tara:strand:+ start:850 stop:1065 length:216 start_codon:yes stop_codon:yes gene_type:complete